MNTTVNKPKMPLLVKIILILIPLAIFGYLITVNFLINQEFNYFYDIGGEEDAVKPYITPINRTSSIYYRNEMNYREINHKFIYISLPNIEGIETLRFNLKLFSEEDTLLVGLKNSTGWNYTWKRLDIVSSNEPGWTEARQEFSLENLFIENERINLILDSPNLSIFEGFNYSIDWINITVYKPGVFS